MNNHKLIELYHAISLFLMHSTALCSHCANNKTVLGVKDMDKNKILFSLLR